MAELDEINKIAQDRFEVLKNKLQLSIQAPAIDSLLRNTKQALTKTKAATYNNLEELYDVIGPEVQKDLHEEATFVDDSFAFIENLELPSTIKLAMGYIIAFSKSKGNHELNKAIAAINKELGE